MAQGSANAADMSTADRVEPTLSGRFGTWGGRFVAETLVPALEELDAAFTAARKGTSSTLSRRARDALIRGSAWCESTPVSPCPGKCLPVAIPPFSSMPRT